MVVFYFYFVSKDCANYSRQYESNEVRRLGWLAPLLSHTVLSSLRDNFDYMLYSDTDRQLYHKRRGRRQLHSAN